MHNGCHEVDREKAASLVKNMIVPDKKSAIWKNPYFSSKGRRLKNIDIHMKDLMNLQQVAENRRGRVSYDMVLVKKLSKDFLTDLEKEKAAEEKRV